MYYKKYYIEYEYYGQLAVIVTAERTCLFHTFFILETMQIYCRNNFENCLLYIYTVSNELSNTYFVTNPSFYVVA